ncbi:MAG: amidohydrolase family protein [Woeseiaceae bacterium]
MRISTWLLALVATIAAANTHAQDLVILADEVYTSGPEGRIEKAAIMISDGKITAIGSMASMTYPADTPQRTAATVIPGLIDSRTTLGLSGAWNIRADQDHNELTAPNQAQLRGIDSYNPSEMLIDFVREHGVTTAHVTPGDGNLIAGQGAIVKLHGDTVAEAVIRPVASMIFNLGESPKESYASRKIAPGTRMASAAIIRQALYAAQHYAEHGGKEGKVDLAVAALVPVVNGEIPAVFTAHREDDISTAIRIGKEFDLDLYIQYATEGYLMRDDLKAAGVKIMAGPALQRLEGLEAYNASLENSGLMHAAGIPVSFSTGHEGYVPKQRILLYEMGVAVANGFPAEAAIAAGTIEAARMLGIDDQVGSIEVGKDADLVLFDGDPFEYTSHIEAVYIDGMTHSQTP